MQVPPASKYQSICGTTTPYKRGAIHAEKRQRDHRYRVAVWTGSAGAAMRKHRGAPRVSVLPIKRMAGADYMAGPSTGAKAEEGRAQISAANLSDGKLTKAKLEKRRENAAKGREISKGHRQMERELIADGLLDNHWRDSFPVLAGTGDSVV